MLGIVICPVLICEASVTRDCRLSRASVTLSTTLFNSFQLVWEDSKYPPPLNSPVSGYDPEAQIQERPIPSFVA
jgi:hypothetical protein